MQEFNDDNNNNNNNNEQLQGLQLANMHNGICGLVGLQQCCCMQLCSCGIPYPPIW